MDHQQVTEIDLVWLTAMIEAEGHVGFHINSMTKNSRRVTVNPQVTFANTDMTLIEEVKRISHGSGIGIYVNGLPKTGSRSTYQIDWRGMKRCLPLLKILIPRMKGRKKQTAKFILAFIESRFSRLKTEDYSPMEVACVQGVSDRNGENRHKPRIRKFLRDYQGAPEKVNV